MFKIIFAIRVVGFLSFSAWIYTLYEEIKDDVVKVINYAPKQTTQFFDKNGKLIANSFKGETRIYVKCSSY